MKIKFYSLLIVGLCLAASSTNAASVSAEAGDLSGKSKASVMESRITFSNKSSKKASKKYSNHLYKKRSLKGLLSKKSKFKSCGAFGE
jgi:hypothetical protein